MTRLRGLYPHPPEFERFLYAPVGTDRKGSSVTVLSALARLGLDPWTETAALVALSRDAARVRLGLLLSKVWDVPALGRDHGTVAQELTLLLPDTPPKAAPTWQAAPLAAGRLGSSTAIWMIFAILFVVAQLLFGGLFGSGE
ncbi:hypothetical protein K7H20_08230 [Salipiger manganoxidans]|uniref:hypothetical protein n=1 Tax=Salipiger marinus TaxID=555512 RepID=UPI001E2B6453|nr:hypothetical protein [Salipiger manganoxidans]MCD1618034.1 hypothetical protein [Salipiger manganoxidans]